MAANLSTDQINYLNIALMVLSAGLAFRFPFELFLFVYAVLGPLHYLTEISWLHDRNYFTRRRLDYLFLVAAGVLVTLSNHFTFGRIGTWLGVNPAVIVYLAFMGSLFFVLFRSLAARLVAMALSAALGLWFANLAMFDKVFAAYLPTLIHVFVFTGLFILAGALKGNSLSGLLSLLVFVGAAAGFVLYHPGHPHYQVSDYVRNSYGYLDDSGSATASFFSLSYDIIRDFRLHDFGQPTQPFSLYVSTINDYLYRNPRALALMSFISYSYCYHYLNWFSKTSIIGWHHIPRLRAVAILLLWGASLALYAYDYSLGLAWLFFLSFAHVLLEFPLNHHAFIGIGKELRHRLSPGPSRG